MVKQDVTLVIQDEEQRYKEQARTAPFKEAREMFLCLANSAAQQAAGVRAATPGLQHGVLYLPQDFS